MDCTIGFWLADCDAVTAAEAFDQAEALVHQAEQVLSRFRPTSELSRLNAGAGRPVAVSPLLWAVLAAGLDAASRTHGLFDPTVLAAMRAAGYDRPFAELVDGRTGTGYRLELRRDGWRSVRLDPQGHTVLLPAGVGIDLGGIAKGWLADYVADTLAAAGPALVDMGGDIAGRGAPAGQLGWPVGIADPLHPDADLVLLALRDQGIATSGRDYRVWQMDGRPHHHLIDPRTGRPSLTDVLATSVVAPTTAAAEVTAKVALLQSFEPGLQWLTDQGARGLLVREDGMLGCTPAFSDITWAQVAREEVLA